jgi:hypothetical protein
MSREGEFVGSLTHSSSFPIYFLLFIIFKVCRVLFCKIYNDSNKTQKIKNENREFSTKFSSLLCSLISDYCSIENSSCASVNFEIQLVYDIVLFEPIIVRFRAILTNSNLSLTID